MNFEDYREDCHWREHNTCRATSNNIVAFSCREEYCAPFHFLKTYIEKNNTKTREDLIEEAERYGIPVIPPPSFYDEHYKEYNQPPGKEYFSEKNRKKRQQKENT